MIDIDEARVILANTNAHYGKTMIGRRCRMIGHYERDNRGRLIIAGIDGSSEGRRWVKAYEDGGTDLERFVDFLQDVLNDIGYGHPGNRRCFMMDNLSTHHHNFIAHMIHGAGHYLVFRAPYWPKDGPIEYFFNYLEVRLTAMPHEIITPEQLEDKIKAIFRTTATFTKWFNHCGFVF